MNTAKNTVFIGLQLENCCLGGEGVDFWWWDSSPIRTCRENPDV